MALPAILGIISLIQGQNNGGQYQPITQNQGYGDNPTEVQPGQRRTFNNLSGDYSTTGNSDGSVAQGQLRVLNNGTGSYMNKQTSDGYQTISGIVNGLKNIQGGGQKQQSYQMPYLQRR